MGAPEASATYKKFIWKFDEEMPQEWIELLQDIHKIWKQNLINGPVDHCSSIRALVRGELLTTFKAALDEARMSEDKTVGQITTDHVESLLKSHH